MNNRLFSNPQVQVVFSFFDLINASFEDGKNAICWERNLLGNFEEIVNKLSLKENITEVFAEDLLNLNLSENADKAKDIILSDLKLLNDFGASPSLNLIKKYEQDHEFDFISTDVYSYHVDRSPIGTDTFLCTYYGAASDILPNDQATQKILIPEVREKLKKIHCGPEEDFDFFLQENFFDLHYQPNHKSQPTNLGIGKLWRLAVDHPEQKTLPCIHRAPLENDGEYRLLLIC